MTPPPLPPDPQLANVLGFRGFMLMRKSATNTRHAAMDGVTHAAFSAWRDRESY